MAIIRPGAVPLWFELGPEGPRRIAHPAEASPEPFLPWPQARYIAGMSPEEGRLVLAVNREGFLVWVPGAEGAALYRVSGGASWEPYTVAALFRFEGKATVLLSRNDFFIDSGAELPAPRVWTLEPESLLLAAREPPAFSPVPVGEGWDLETLRQGPDGFWYFRGVQKDAPRPEIRYFRTPDLGRAGEASSAGLFRTASSPYTRESAPQPLRAVLEAAAAWAGKEKDPIAAVVSPAFPSLRYYQGAAGESGVEPMELAGFYRPAPGAEAVTGAGLAGGNGAEVPGAAVAGAGLADSGGAEAPGPGLAAGNGGFAAVVFPGGRGFYARGGPAVEAFSLPPLPEGFVYTGIGLSGDTLIAAWEEQDEWQVGAAGFMIVQGP
jgi:hypothetical protein